MLRNMFFASFAFAAAFACSGCSKTGVVVGDGQMNRSVQFIGVPRYIEVANATDLVKRGNSTTFDVQLRNRHTKRKVWQLEYKVQFFDSTGRELACFPRGWTIATIGRGELKTLGGSCHLPDAATATMIFRKWRAKE